MACGWICPFGFLQDILFRVNTSIKKIPAFLNYMPWVFLILTVIALPFFTTEHWFSKLCPVGTLVAGLPWVFWNPIDPSTGNLTIEQGGVSFIFFIKVIILFGCLIAFVYIKRPFCRFVCPMGLFWSFFNKISVLRLEVGEGCNHGEGCKGFIRCRQKCPMDIKVFEDPNSKDCVRCLECTATCDKVKVVCAWPGKSENRVTGIEGRYE
jgi:polyferredoxin